MKVKCSYPYADGKVCLPAGSIVEVSEDVGRKMIMGLYACRVDDKGNVIPFHFDEPECATTETPETAAMPRVRRKRVAKVEG